MKLNSIRLRHAHHFADLSIEFKYSNKPISIILGDQSAGKTAILKNIYQALTWFPARFKDTRTAGVVMPDSDIKQNHLQSRIDISVEIPAEYAVISEHSSPDKNNPSVCSWRLYKTLNANGVGFSKVETQQLEQCIESYHKTNAQDPLLGLPMIAYYPSDRFVNDLNLISKNNPVVFQNHSAYELISLPYTTFARFFEWFREISDIENAQTAQLFQQILFDAQHSTHLTEEEKKLELSHNLFQVHAQLYTPTLNSLNTALHTVIPEITDMFLEYQPKLQLMVNYNQQIIPYSQLSNSIKNWTALVGDIVRRLSLLNPKSLFPCLEGNGILLIDSIDAQLDSTSAQNILDRLNQAFPKLQIIATGSSEDLLENAENYQYLKLQQQQIKQLSLPVLQISVDRIYQELFTQVQSSQPETLAEPTSHSIEVDKIFESFRSLSTEQQQQLIQLMRGDDNLSKLKI